MLYQIVFQARSFFTMFTIINIIIIIYKFHATVCSWLQDDIKQPCLVLSSNPSGVRYSVVQGRSPCSGSWVHVVLWRSFSIFHSVSDLLIAASKVVRRSSFAKALASDRISITGSDYWCCRKNNTSLESHLLVQIATSFKIQYRCKRASSSNWDICISNNNKNNLDFYFKCYCFEFSFYIF